MGLPSWNMTPSGTVPYHMAYQAGDVDTKGCCDPWEEERQHVVYRNRTSAAVDLDDMLSTIFEGLDKFQVRNNTYVIFSSDNGYHLGEHHLLFGKAHPYETDVRLPMYITGPGVVQGEIRPHPTTHLDITATIAELAGATKFAPHALDGKSFHTALTRHPPSVNEWRKFSYSEFYQGYSTWRNIRFINESTGEAEWTFHWWCTNQSEVFHRPSDQYQMRNLGGDAPTAFGQRIIDVALLATEVIGTCFGEECNEMPSTGKAKMSLKCNEPGVNDLMASLIV